MVIHFCVFVVQLMLMGERYRPLVINFCPSTCVGTGLCQRYRSCSCCRASLRLRNNCERPPRRSCAQRLQADCPLKGSETCTGCVNFFERYAAVSSGFCQFPPRCVLLHFRAYLLAQCWKWRSGRHIRQFLVFIIHFIRHLIAFIRTTLTSSFHLMTKNVCVHVMCTCGCAASLVLRSLQLILRRLRLNLTPGALMSLSRQAKSLAKSSAHS